jgi:hypothetical protein
VLETNLAWIFTTFSLIPNDTSAIYFAMSLCQVLSLSPHPELEQLFSAIESQKSIKLPMKNGTVLDGYEWTSSCETLLGIMNAKVRLTR